MGIGLTRRQNVREGLFLFGLLGPGIAKAVDRGKEWNVLCCIMVDPSAKMVVKGEEETWFKTNKYSDYCFSVCDQIALSRQIVR